MNRRELATQYFLDGYNCSQAVLGAFAEEYADPARFNEVPDSIEAGDEPDVEEANDTDSEEGHSRKKRKPKKRQKKKRIFGIVLIQIL